MQRRFRLAGTLIGIGLTAVVLSIFSRTSPTAAESAKAVATPTVIATVPVGYSPQGVGVNPTTNRVYVASESCNCVSVIDGATNTVVATVPVGNAPQIGVGVNSITNRVYVSNDNGSSVSVIDGTSNTVVATVPVGVQPGGVGVNPTTNRVYVANYHDNTVSVIDGATNTVVTTVEVGSGPTFVAVNPTTNRLYVGNAVGNSVSVIDEASDTVVATVPVGSYPQGVGANATTNHVYVVNYLDNTVSVIDGTSNAVVATVSVGSSPLGVGVNPATNLLYVGYVAGKSVSVVNGASDTVIATVSVGNQPRAVGVNSTTNRVYVANTSDNTVSVIADGPSSALPILTFPLKGSSPGANLHLNPYTAQINSVFDHSMTVPYSCDDTVVTYAGEKGSVNGIGGGTFPSPCEEAWAQPSGNLFFVNGNYSGGGDLYYDGHPGIDYQAGLGTEVYAAASGTIHYPANIVGFPGAQAAHTMELDPSSAENYFVYYLHLSTYNGETPFQYTDPNPAPGCPTVVWLPIPDGNPVTAGCLVALSGSAGTKAAHLHFEVHQVVPLSQVPAKLQSKLQCYLPQGGRDPNNACVPVDPYGWDGTGADPYHKKTSVSNVRLWTYTPAIDKVRAVSVGGGSYTVTITGQGLTGAANACFLHPPTTSPSSVSTTCLDPLGTVKSQTDTKLVVTQTGLASGTYYVGAAIPSPSGDTLVLGSNWKTVVIP